MELHKAILALETSAREINGGINAIGIMTAGLSATNDPYADGFNAVWNYLFDANQDLQTKIQACLTFVP